MEIWAGQINYDGLGKDDGPRLSWRIPTDGFVWATWTPDYKSLNDPVGYVVEREFDQTFNKPLYEENQNGRETRWKYDEKGNLTKIVNAAGNVSTFSYNQYGQLISSTDFNGNTTTFAYTPAWDLASVTDALGNVTTFEYDGLGRMIKRANPLGVEFAYQ